MLRGIFPDGAKSVREVNKKPSTVGTVFKVIFLQHSKLLFPIQSSSFNGYNAVTFQNSMSDLVQQLSTKEPYYIRCIKPNDNKSGTSFDTIRVGHQVASPF